MLNRAMVYQLADEPKRPEDAPLRRHGKPYLVGTQRPHRSRMFYFRTALEYREPDSSEDVIRMRRKKPAASVVVSSIWTTVPDTSDVWTSDTPDTETWTAETPTSTTWS